MHVLIQINNRGEETAIVAKRATSLRGYIKAANAGLGTWCMAWRYHDGTGWADESPEGWKHIQSMTGPRPTTIVY